MLGFSWKWGMIIKNNLHVLFSVKLPNTRSYQGKENKSRRNFVVGELYENDYLISFFIFTVSNTATQAVFNGNNTKINKIFVIYSRE